MSQLAFICRWLRGVVVALVYQAATNPFVLAFLLLLTRNWNAALWLICSWGVLCAIAVATGVHRNSTLPNLEDREIFTARRFLHWLGDEQQGWTPAFLVAQWPRWAPLWLIAFCCCAWRNKLRNMPFSPALAWIHRPKGELALTNRRFGSLLLRNRVRGWMTESEYFYRDRFGDFGPRLDQPDEWGAVSWAFVPWGKLR